jgi:hypothetical protein
MLFLVFFALLLMIVHIDNVFGEGDEKNRVTYDSFKMLHKFDKKILQPLIGFCPKEKFGVNVENIDKTRPKWILCVPVISLDAALANFANKIKEENLNELKFKEDDKWASFTK